ncbi:hypothetical protein CDV31_009277 [Fusarium ambrosium]|uniref:Uncharacterized protein n=1 Tax=Fusarium ambrosium TaxID=131363 RepID=A0A428TVL5_9HYPO|nr:hypothetical protein CDV31_009277 [Fusarium ambrosium]
MPRAIKFLPLGIPTHRVPPHFPYFQPHDPRERPVAEMRTREGNQDKTKQKDKQEISLTLPLLCPAIIPYHASHHNPFETLPICFILTRLSLQKLQHHNVMLSDLKSHPKTIPLLL